jgi:hypothetical protein
MIEFLEALQGQLVAASRELSDQRHPTVHKARRWRRRRLLLALAGAVVVAGAAIAAATQLATNDRGIEAMQRLPTIAREHRDHPIVRAFGLDPGQATVALTTPGGLTVAKVGDAGEVCLLVSDGEDQCYATTNVTAGRGYSIDNDCSRGSGYPMRIMGVTPHDAARVKVRYSAGPGLDAKVINDTFLIDTTTPGSRDPYPLEIQYLDNKGTTLASTPIPGGDDLCLHRQTPGP